VTNETSTSSSVHQVEKKMSEQSNKEISVGSITSTSVSEDLLILSTPTDNDPSLQALVDSGATSDFISEEYVRDHQLNPQSLDNPLRIRLADGSTSIART
jgi:hypothetical protein